MIPDRGNQPSNAAQAVAEPSLGRAKVLAKHCAGSGAKSLDWIKSLDGMMSRLRVCQCTREPRIVLIRLTAIRATRFFKPGMARAAQRLGQPIGDSDVA